MNQLPLLDIHFDNLDIPCSTQASFRNRRRTPHCDCRQANEAFFGVTLSSTSSSVNQADAFTLVPTELAHDDKSICKHCRYYVVMQEERDLRHAKANLINSLRAAKKNEAAFAVVGTHVETGEVITFPTAKAAYLAGHGAVNAAIRQGRVLRGIRWQLANKDKLKTTR